MIKTNFGKKEEHRYPLLRHHRLSDAVILAVSDTCGTCLKADSAKAPGLLLGERYENLTASEWLTCTNPVIMQNIGCVG